jgi:hypothetical protein
MKNTTLQITLDVVHGDDVEPAAVAHHAGDIAHDSIVWTEWPELANSLDKAYRAGDAGVGIVSSIVIATRDYEQGRGARSYDDEKADEDEAS